MRSYQGKILDILVEGESRFRKGEEATEVRLGWAKEGRDSFIRLVGRTEGDEIVAFKGPRHLIGTIIPVRAVGATPITIQGEWVQPKNKKVSELNFRKSEGIPKLA